MTQSVATTYLSVLALAIIAVAVYTDVRWGKILNKLTVPAMAVALALSAAWMGPAGLLHSAEGMALGCALFLLALWFAPLFGSGDVKLLMAVGACLGPTFLMWNLLYMALTGVALAAVVSAYHSLARPSTASPVTGFYLSGGQAVRFTSVPMATLRVPYAVAIGLGTLITLIVTAGV